jgi:molybdate transport system regulatory protein
MAVPQSHASILAGSMDKTVDPVRLEKLEQAFRTWANTASGPARRLSRLRILLVFLIIRYTGARLNEVLTLSAANIDLAERHICFRNRTRRAQREVQIPERLADELASAMALLRPTGGKLKIDPAHVRRRFYDCARAAGIPRKLGTPEAIRKSRAVELMQSDVPLPVVQRIMGHSTPNLAASYVRFSDEDIRRVERLHLERETRRRTSARNRFYGKIERVDVGDVQASIELASIDGHRIVAVITRDSQRQLGLKRGRLIAAEVKAPWVTIYKGIESPRCAAENRFMGIVSRITIGKINSEVVLRVWDTVELCSILTEKSRSEIGIKEGDTVWAVFNAASVIIEVG